jgi:hypothetical protein
MPTRDTEPPTTKPLRPRAHERATRDIDEAPSAVSDPDVEDDLAVIRPDLSPGSDLSFGF